MKIQLNAKAIRRVFPVVGIVVLALLAMTAGVSAVRTANAPQAQTIAMPPTIEAEVLAEQAEFQQWAALRAAWDDSRGVSRYDEDHPDVAYRADLAYALAALPAWVSETLPPTAEWPKLRAQLAVEARKEHNDAKWRYEETVAEWERQLGHEISPWGYGLDDAEASEWDNGGWSIRPVVGPAYPHGWWESDRLKDHQHIDALWSVVQAAGDTPQARAEFIRQAYGPIDSRALPADYVQVLTAPRPTGTVAALWVTSGALMLTAVAGAVLLYRRRKGASS